jgi:hypothetical protein
MTDQRLPTDAQMELDLRRSFEAAIAPPAPETILDHVARLGEPPNIGPRPRWLRQPSIALAGLALVASVALVSTVLFLGSVPHSGGQPATGQPSPSLGTFVATPSSTPSAVTPVPAQDLRAVPLPLDTFSGTVRDPSEATLSLVDALKIVRALTDNIVGPDPVARYMLMTVDTARSNGGFKDRLVWVFVADDVKPIMGTGLPTTNSPPPYLGTLSWTIIDMNGHLLAQMQKRYFAPNTPPTLPHMTTPAGATPPIVPSTCHVTKPTQPFIPPAGYAAPTQPPGYYNAEWIGTARLWTMVPRSGEVWYGLPQGPDGLSQKTYWWSADFDVTHEPHPAISVLGHRLDGPGRFEVPGPGTNAEADFGSAMLVGVDIPTAGCWQITATYRQASLTYIAWVSD